MPVEIKDEAQLLAWCEGTQAQLLDELRPALLRTLDEDLDPGPEIAVQFAAKCLHKLGERSLYLELLKSGRPNTVRAIELLGRVADWCRTAQAAKSNDNPSEPNKRKPSTRPRSA